MACSDVPARQEAPAAGIKNTLKMIETLLLLHYDRGKPKPLHGACNNRDVSTALLLKLPRELGSEKVQIGEEQGKSGNWESLTSGSSEEKLLHLMGSDPGKAQAALSSASEAEQLH